MSYLQVLYGNICVFYDTKIPMVSIPRKQTNDQRMWILKNSH